MDLREHIDPARLYHAYVIEDFDGATEALHALLAGAHPNAEYHERTFNTFTIAESRQLVRRAHLRSRERQFFLYRARAITHEAQNALLKLVEEPPHKTHIFISVGSLSAIAPTLRSRVWIVAHDQKRAYATADITHFMRASIAERLAYVAPIIKDKDVGSADALVRDITTYLHAHALREDARALLRHTTQVRRALNGRGASLKQLLESIVVSIPKFS